MDELQRHYLAVMGIQVWEAREVPHSEAEHAPVAEVVPPVKTVEEMASPIAAPAPEPIVTEPEVESTTNEVGIDIANLDWSALREQVSQCTVCDELVANRTQTVFGVGNQQAELLVIGEAPGADEDREGEPFVGRAGQLLNAMLIAIGLPRDQVYIANILKCRPPNNRDPKPEEATACRAFLKRQIALIQPKVILVVGRIAAQNLLHTDAPLGKLRGQLHYLDSGVPVVVTYHPAYLLRSPQEKRKAWLDLCLASDTLSRSEESVQ